MTEQPKETGFFKINYPGILNASMPLDETTIDQCIHVLQLVKEWVEEQKGQMQKSNFPDLQESDLLDISEVLG